MKQTHFGRRIARTSDPYCGGQLVRRLLLALFVLAPTAGCGASMEDVAAPLEGTYAVETWTLNREGCDSEGASMVDELQERYLTLAQGSAMNALYLEAVSCSDTADCQQKADAIPKHGSFMAWYTFSFTEAKSAAALYGQYVSTGFSSSDSPSCTEGELSDRTLRILDGGGIRIEERTRIAAEYPKDDRGYCTTEGTLAAAKGKACSRFQVITAKRVEG